MPVLPFTNQQVSVPDLSTFTRVSWMDRVSLLPILPLRDPEFVGLAAAFGPLMVALLFHSLTPRLHRAPGFFLWAVARCAVSVPHNSSRQKCNMKAVEATCRAFCLAAPGSLDDREVITHDGLVIDKRRVHAQAVEIEHERSKHVQRQTHGRMLQPARARGADLSG